MPNTVKMLPFLLDINHDQKFAEDLILMGKILMFYYFHFIYLGDQAEKLLEPYCFCSDLFFLLFFSTIKRNGQKILTIDFRFTPAKFSCHFEK